LEYRDQSGSALQCSYQEIAHRSTKCRLMLMVESVGRILYVCWAESARECDACSRLLSCVYHPSTGDNIMWYCSLVDCTRGKGGVKYRRKKGSLLKKRLKPDRFWKKMGYSRENVLYPVTRYSG
jgi:hypothetical protein